CLCELPEMANVCRDLLSVGDRFKLTAILGRQGPGAARIFIGVKELQVYPGSISDCLKNVRRYVCNAAHILVDVRGTCIRALGEVLQSEPGARGGEFYPLAYTRALFRRLDPYCRSGSSHNVLPIFRGRH